MDADRVQYVENELCVLTMTHPRSAYLAASSTKLLPSWSTALQTPAASARQCQVISCLPKCGLRTRLDASLRRVYGLRGFESALSDARASMMQEVRDDLRPDAESLGVSIVDVPHP